MTEKTIIQKERIARYAAQQGMNVTEYRRRYDQNTAANQGLTVSEYVNKRKEAAAKAKGMTKNEYMYECYERYAIKKGFRNRKEYDRAYKRAKARKITLEVYCASLEKDDNGYFIVPDLKNKNGAARKRRKNYEEILLSGR